MRMFFHMRYPYKILQLRLCQILLAPDTSPLNDSSLSNHLESSALTLQTMAPAHISSGGPALSSNSLVQSTLLVAPPGPSCSA